MESPCWQPCEVQEALDQSSQPGCVIHFSQGALNPIVIVPLVTRA